MDYSQIAAVSAAQGMDYAGDGRRMGAFSGNGTGRGHAGSWTAAELRFVDKNVGRLSYRQIGQKLGRTRTAVLIQIKRRGIARASKRGSLTARDVGELLGMDGKAVGELINRGLLKARVLPLDARIYAVEEHDLLRFCLRPESWLYVPSIRKQEWHRIKSAKFRRFIQIAQAKWGDRWLSLSEATAEIGVCNSILDRWYNEGRMPGLRWNVVYVRRSDLLEMYAANTTFHRYSPGFDRFLLLGRAMGLTYDQLAAMSGKTRQHVAYRLRNLLDSGDAALFAEVGITANGRIPYVDWRLHRGRFPLAERLVGRFWAGQSGKRVVICVHNLLLAAVRRFAPGVDEELERGLNFPSSLSRWETLDRRRRQVVDLIGFDPLEMERDE